jgi:hypothetical protein
MKFHLKTGAEPATETRRLVWEYSAMGEVQNSSNTELKAAVEMADYQLLISYLIK